MDLISTRNRLAYATFIISLAAGSLTYFVPDYLGLILLAQGLSLITAYSISQNIIEKKITDRYENEIKKLKKEIEKLKARA